MNADTIFFYCMAALAVVSALLVITRTNPMKSVLFLIVNFFSLAVLYLTLHAQFIAVIQIIVYAGAIMVLFLFVIMLLNLGEESVRAGKPGIKVLLAIALATAVLVEIIVGVGLFSTAAPAAPPEFAVRMGTVEFIGSVLYTGYLLPFEVTSILLLAAMVGVIVLAKKKLE